MRLFLLLALVCTASAHVAYADRILSFDFDAGAPAHYEGAVSRDATEIAGHLNQNGTPIPLKLTRTDAAPNDSRASSSNAAQRKA